jgi:hypothetical protein
LRQQPQGQFEEKQQQEELKEEELKEEEFQEEELEEEQQEEELKEIRGQEETLNRDSTAVQNSRPTGRRVATPVGLARLRTHQKRISRTGIPTPAAAERHGSRRYTLPLSRFVLLAVR